MERTPRKIPSALIAAAVSAVAADAAAQANRPEVLDPATMPPAAAPIQFGWNQFRSIAIPRGIHREVERLIRHGFYAGARVARQTMTDGLSEMAGDDPELAARGEERLASLEIEIERYFSQMMAEVNKATEARILRP